MKEPDTLSSHPSLLQDSLNNGKHSEHIPEESNHRASLLPQRQQYHPQRLSAQVHIPSFRNSFLCQESNQFRRKTWARSSKQRSRPSKEALPMVTAPSLDQRNSAALSSSCLVAMDQWEMARMDKTSCDWSMDSLMDFIASMIFLFLCFKLSSAISLFQIGLMRL